MRHPVHLLWPGFDGTPLASGPLSEPSKGRFRDGLFGTATRMKPEQATTFDPFTPAPGVEINPAPRRSRHHRRYPEGAVDCHTVAPTIPAQTESGRGLRGTGEGASIGARKSVDLEELRSLDPQHALEQ